MQMQLAYNEPMQLFEIKESTISGKGLFAKVLIPKGTVVLAWKPKVLTRQEAKKLPEEEQKHYLYPDGEKMLWMQPPERYVNHSCEPNTHVEGQSDVASRDIQPGEEITSDYMDLETENFTCHCGSEKCRNPALGLRSGIVKLVEYNSSWPKLYELEADNLCEALKISPERIQHVGSTSIPSMPSKPILDIAILVDSLDTAEDWIEPLAKLGYWYKGIEPDLPDRRFFAKGPREKRTVYVHVVNNREFESLLKFRDRLRDNPKLTKEYATLKQGLATEHENNRDAYTRSKNNFIRSVIQD